MSQKERARSPSCAPLGEIILSPFVVSHTSGELSALTNQLKSLDGETRVVMQATGNYHLPIEIALHASRIYARGDCFLYSYYNSEQPLIQVKICTAVDKEKEITFLQKC